MSDQARPRRPGHIWHNQEVPSPAQKGAALLNRLMASKGYSPADVADRTGRKVSESSIRAYRAGEYVPRAGTAILVAAIFGREEGSQLLTTWGFPEAAEAVAEGQHEVENLQDAFLREHSSIEVAGSEFRIKPSHRPKARRLVDVFMTQDGGVGVMPHGSDEPLAYHVEDEDGWQVISYRGKPMNAQEFVRFIWASLDDLLEETAREGEASEQDAED